MLVGAEGIYVSCKVSYETNNSNVDDDTRLMVSGSMKGLVLQELRDEISELKFEVLLLREEVLKNKQRMISLESGKNNYGKDVKKRVHSMILLVKDYGGSLTSSSIKKYMGLSKDELYRTLKCAKEEGMIEFLPDPRDRRGYIITIKPGS
jgi:DNA-binding MarR family transcriptional regulator